MGIYEVYIPVNLNDGTDVAADTLEGILGDALDTFGGVTYDPSQRRGMWRGDDGTVYVDRITVAMLFCDDEPRVVDFAARVARLLDQLAVSVITPDRRAILAQPA
jgi:hypothetical protein